MERLAEKLRDVICRNNPGYTYEQSETIRFGLECALNEITKTLIYLLIFTAMSLTGHFLVALVFFWLTRIFAGGFHADTFVQCFLVTFTMLFSAIFTGSNLGLTFQVRIILLAASLILAVIYAPVDHPNKPIISLKRRRRFKILSVAAFIFLSGVSFLLEERYAATAVLILFLEALSLPAGQIAKRRMRNEYTGSSN